MIFSRDYSRAILTLRQEEGGFSAENGVFGRAVVEIRNGRARVMVYAQGLKSGSMCSLYFICRKKDDFVPLKAVLVNTKNGRAEVKWEFNPDNILGSGLRIEDAAAMAVLTEKGEAVLAAYFDKPVNWRAHSAYSVEAASETVCETAKEDKADGADCDDNGENKETSAKSAETEASEVSQEAPENDGSQTVGTENYTENNTANNAGSNAENNTENNDVSDNGDTAKGILDFTKAVNRFRKDLDELRRYAYMEKLDRQEAERRKTPCMTDMEYLFENREEIRPFENDSGRYRKIGLRDLSLIDRYVYKYENNPTVIRRWLKYGYIVLGEKDGELLLLLPCEKNKERSDAEIGFDEFMDCGGGFGYSVLKIKKENGAWYEDTKEKLDARRA